MTPFLCIVNVFKIVYLVLLLIIFLITTVNTKKLKLKNNVKNM